MSVVGTFLPPDVSFALSDDSTMGNFVRSWIAIERGHRFAYHHGFLARDRDSDPEVDAIARLALTLALPVGTKAQVCMDLGLDHPPMGIACLTQKKLGKDHYEYWISKRKSRAVTRDGIIRREPIS